MSDEVLLDSWVGSPVCAAFDDVVFVSGADAEDFGVILAGYVVLSAFGEAVD